MEDIVERYLSKVLKFHGSEDDCRKLLTEFANSIGYYRINTTVKFFHRQNHSKKLSEKASFEIEYNKFISDVDDLTAINKQYWKDLDAKYRYYYKEIKRK